MGQYQRKIRRLVGAYYWAFDSNCKDLWVSESMRYRITASGGD
jgi:hypothetical protein